MNKIVPPAGDVEVLAWMYQRKGGEILGPLVAVETEEMKRIREGISHKGRTLSSPRSDYFDWRPLVGLAHVTRLTAERDGLLVKLETQQNHFREQLRGAKCADALQSELTKARELLTNLVAENDLAMPDGSQQWRYSPMRQKCLDFIGAGNGP